jgi:UPF0755 protein
MRALSWLLAAVALIVLGAGGWFAVGWYGASELEQDTNFTIAPGSSLTTVAQKLEEEGIVASAEAFLLRAKILGGGDPIQAGEFALPAGASPASILAMFQSGDTINRFITIPEGMPSILVYERLLAEDLLTGEIPVPEEGSVLPDTYSFERGESRMAVLARMQAAMRNYLAEAWPRRKPGIAVDNLRDAVVLASIVEKETGKPSERRMVAGLYSNRVKTGMLLQADPTVIYPITRGKPLGRRIRQSELRAINEYNTYAMLGLPKGPITNPGRESIAAVLDPAATSAVYMVADGTGGHKFADTLDEHNANVAEWYELRRQRGEM